MKLYSTEKMKPVIRQKIHPKRVDEIVYNISKVRLVLGVYHIRLVLSITFFKFFQFFIDMFLFFLYYKHMMHTLEQSTAQPIYNILLS